MRLAPLFTIVIAVAAFGGVESEPDLEFATIGDLGNPGYPGGEYGVLEGRGSVDYVYRISILELRTADLLEFANTFAPQSDELADLFWGVNWAALPVPFYQGPGELYELAPSIQFAADVPVGISWRLAAMYCNWLHHGKLSEPASLLDGAYDTATFGEFDADSGGWPDQSTHHPDARFWIPTLDEWIKAAHYDPDKNGQGPGWWEYPHSSDDEPVPGLPGEGDTVAGLPNEVVQGWGAFGTSRFPIGAFPDVRSPWGLLDTVGGGTEWTEEWDYAVGSRFDRWTKGSRASTAPYDPFRDLVWVKFVGGFPTSASGTVRVVSTQFCRPDLTPPFGVLDLRDIVKFILAYQAGYAAADFAPPRGVFNIEDVRVFIDEFLSGCPE